MDGFEIIDPRFRRFVLPNAPLERLADGFRWLEGPVWFADMRCLLVSDIPNDRIVGRPVIGRPPYIGGRTVAGRGSSGPD